MEVPCVRVHPEAGEETRRRLAEGDLIADEYDITVDEEWLYVPVLDPDAVPEELTVVTHAVPERETQTTPADLLGYEPSYERLGEVAILDEDDPTRAREIARAIVDSDLPIDTVLGKASKIKGETRVRDWEVLVREGGSDERDDSERSSPTEVVHREYGCEFHLDLAAVYFSPRLATERHRVAEQVGSEPPRTAENASGQRPRTTAERAFDMFAGVGPFVIPFAKRGAECVGVDVNERAIEYLEENARRNGVEDRITAIAADVREVAGDPEFGYDDWADRIVMNLPHSADAFLDTAVTIAGDDCTLHYYDIQHEDDPFGPGERAIRDAAEPAYTASVETRHIVRSYAPHELNVCLDVRLERSGDSRSHESHR